MSRLRFHDCLGRGGYGAVYRATWYTARGMQLEVAVKVLNATVARGSDAQHRLRDEARLLGALTHPGIVRVYDLVVVRGAVGMIAEYVEGHDLDRCVLDGLPARALVEVVSKVSSALAAAWADLSPVSGKPLRLVHRDIKPENLRVTPTGVVKILDFGVARAAEVRRESETASNMVLGSYRYMAPERFDQGLEPHPSVDVFALGAILYEGLAYRRLFEHLSVREMLVLSLPGTDRYENYIDERIAELPADTDPNLVALIRRLVSREASERPMPGRLAAICDDLADSLDGLGLGQWSRSREWEYVSSGDGDLTGEEVTLETGQPDAMGMPLFDEHTFELAQADNTQHALELAGITEPIEKNVSLDDPDLQETVKATSLPLPTPAPPRRQPDEPVPDPAAVADSEFMDPWSEDPDQQATLVLSASARRSLAIAPLAGASETVSPPENPAKKPGLPSTFGPPPPSAVPTTRIKLLVPEDQVTADVPPPDASTPVLPLPDSPTEPDIFAPESLGSSRPKLYAAERLPDLGDQDEDDTVEVTGDRPVPQAPARDTEIKRVIAANIAAILVLTVAGIGLLIAWAVLA